MSLLDFLKKMFGDDLEKEMPASEELKDARNQIEQLKAQLEGLETPFYIAGSGRRVYDGGYVLADEELNFDVPKGQDTVEVFINGSDHWGSSPGHLHDHNKVWRMRGVGPHTLHLKWRGGEAKATMYFEGEESKAEAAPPERRAHLSLSGHDSRDGQTSKTAVRTFKRALEIAGIGGVIIPEVKDMKEAKRLICD